MPNYRVTVEMIVSAKNDDAAQDEALAACRLADDMENLISYDAKGAELVEDLDSVELSPRAHYRISFEDDGEQPNDAFEPNSCDPQTGLPLDSARATHRAQVLREIDAQEQWILSRGRNVEGYIERYGPKPCPVCKGTKKVTVLSDYNPRRRCPTCAGSGQYVFGEGGEAIYNADAAELNRLLDKALALA